MAEDVGPPSAPGQARDLLSQLTSTLFGVGLLLQAAVDLPGDAAREHITEALSRLDEAIRAARDHAFTEHSPEARSSLARSPLGEPGRVRWSASRAALLRERMVETARALQRSAAENAALLEQRAGLVKEPGRADYRTEIKRWRDFADQVGQMASGLEHEP